MARKVLYHYTCTYHLPTILRTKYLKLTEANLRADIENFKKVVWLTDLENPTAYELGIDLSSENKTEIRITVEHKKSYKYWKVWSRKNKITKDWAEFLEKDRSPNNWWISEKIIPIDDFLLIENTTTGEILFQKN